MNYKEYATNCKKYNFNIDELNRCLKEDGIDVEEITRFMFYKVVYKYRKFVLGDESVYDIQVSKLLNNMGYFNESTNKLYLNDFNVFCKLYKVNSIKLKELIKSELEEIQLLNINISKMILNHIELLVEKKYQNDSRNMLTIDIDTVYKYTKEEAIDFVKNCVVA